MNALYKLGARKRGWRPEDPIYGGKNETAKSYSSWLPRHNRSYGRSSSPGAERMQLLGKLFLFCRQLCI